MSEDCPTCGATLEQIGDTPSGRPVYQCPDCGNQCLSIGGTLCPVPPTVTVRKKSQ
jgi:DNA-directed RNA polymerase subunit RPC12/RpoP